MSGEYDYDALGRKTAETVHYPDFSKTHEKTWHANGRQASLTALDGTTYGFSWDSADRMQALTIPGQGVIGWTEYEWHQPTRIEFPGGTVREETFDGLQRHQTIQVTSETGQVLMDYAYTWDETGNITEKATEHGIYHYGYDDIDRLTEAEYPTFSAEEWTYDPLGNRITDAKTGEEPWQYNDNNELLSSVEYSHEYDDNGSLIAEYHPDGTLYRTFDYNAETRLSAVRDPNGELIAEYLYDPFGRRVKKTVYDPPGQNPETTWYVYSDQGLMAELDETGQETDFYLFPPDGLWSTDPILRKSSSSYFYYQTDHLGSPQQLIDGTGAVVHSREMRAFGEVSATGMEDRWRFPGQLHSAETGLYYNYFRDYQPSTGRYVQIDPIGLRGGINTFGYGRINPIRLVDPRGLAPWDPDFWEGQLGQISSGTNCWGYAIDRPFEKGNPGGASGFGSQSCARLIANAKSEGLIEPDPEGQCGGRCPKGHYKVQVFLSDEFWGRRDFHWYRQDDDDHWSHKRGSQYPSRTDASGNVLICPKEQDRDYGDGGRNYSAYCGTLCVPDRRSRR